jgi:hypothetical protein
MTSRPEIHALALCAGLLLAGADAAAAETIRPGYWESTTQVTTPIQSTKTERRCVTPKEVARFTTCYINHHYKCSCPQQSYDSGRISFRGDCVDAKNRHVQIEGEGSYTSTTLQMTAKGQFKLVGLPVNFSASTQSHRIADICPAGSEGNETPRNLTLPAFAERVTR